MISCEGHLDFYIVWKNITKSLVEKRKKIQIFFVEYQRETLGKVHCAEC
jgi:hypothetical protein